MQVGVDDWLVLDDVFHPRALIHRGPAVWQATGETFVVYRVERWALEREHRRVLGRYELLADAIARAEAEYAGSAERPQSWDGRDGNGANVK